MKRFRLFKQLLFCGKVFEAQDMIKTCLVYAHGVEDSAGVTPAHWAAFGGNVTLIQWLENQGEDLYKCDKAGRSVLSYAINGRQLKVQWLSYIYVYIYIYIYILYMLYTHT